MKKNLFFAAMAIVLASCASDDFVGENNNSPNPVNGPEKAIVFNSGANAVTRAEHTGAEAAGMLSNKFVFAGTKGEGATSFVFDQYTAKYVANTANTTESNSSNWEYVGQTLAPTSSLTAGTSQTIKYWDYSTSQYDFAAYSLGVAIDHDNDASTDPATAAATAIAAGNKSYTITGTVDQLKNCYISDLVTVYNKKAVADDPATTDVDESSPAANEFGNVVTFKFRSLASKIRIAFYETVPGYSVGDVKFYADATTTTATDVPTLFTSSDVLPSGSGTMTVTFPTTGWSNRAETDYNKAHISFGQESGVDAVSTLTFDALANYATAEGDEVLATAPAVPTTGFLGRTSNTATYAGGLVSGSGKYYSILPKGAGANLLLRIKYTLLSTDGSKESITVDNATAVVPAELANWDPNYAYTYIFKISDMTNGSTGEDGNGNVVTGLTPITLNAVVIDSEDGLQETITTVSAPSITTYTKGEVVTTQSEYSKNANIYIIVNNGTSNVALTPGTNAWLYTATLEDGAAQTLNEASVDNALHYGTYASTAKTYTVLDANGKNMVLTDVTANKQTADASKDLFQTISEIAATDSPTGNRIVVTGAKFYPEAEGKYVFAYQVSGGSATATTDAYDATATYYSMTPTNRGFYLKVDPATVAADATSGWDANKSKYTTNPTQPVYAYKIIIVQ